MKRQWARSPTSMGQHIEWNQERQQSRNIEKVIEFMTWSKMYSQSLYIITDVLFNFRPHSYSNAEYILEDFRWFEWKFIFNICFYCVMLSWRVLVYQWLFLFPYYPAPVKTEMIVFYKCAHGVSYCIYLVKPSRWLAPVATASCLHHTKVNSLAHGRS